MLQNCDWSEVISCRDITLWLNWKMRFFDILDTFISKKFQNGRWITRKIKLLKNAEHRPINILSANVYKLVNKSILNVTTKN